MTIPLDDVSKARKQLADAHSKVIAWSMSRPWDYENWRNVSTQILNGMVMLDRLEHALRHGGKTDDE